MPYIYENGVVVSQEELDEKLNSGELAEYEQRLQDDRNASFTFRDGVVPAPRGRPAAPGAGFDVIDYEKIGIGQPLSLEILGYYTGDLPRIGRLGKTSMLVCSACKAIETYEAQPWAVNQMENEVEEHQYLRPSAGNEGSPLVYYSAAMPPNELLVDLSLKVDRFDETILYYLSDIMKGAAGLPVFVMGGPTGVGIATAALVGATLLRQAGELGKALWNSKTILQHTLSLTFNKGGVGVIPPKAYLACNTQDEGKFEGYIPVLVDGGTPSQHWVMKKGDRPYNGPAPYMILNLDGREREGLENFKARLATAAILEKFVGTQDPGSTVVSVINEAMGLYNDVTFRRKAQTVQKDIETLDAEIAEQEAQARRDDTEETLLENSAYQAKQQRVEKLREKLQAYQGNIQNEEFRP